MEGSKQLQAVERPRLGTTERLVDQRVEQGIAVDQGRELGAFAELTDGRFQPQLAYKPRFAGHLAVGEVAIEPVLGPARVAGIERDDEAVVVGWKDDYGSSNASARYGADQVFFVRVPGPRDLLSIQQQVDRAIWRRSDIPGSVARLIAAHLHLGPRSAMFRFAIDGAILDDRIYDELDSIKRHRLTVGSWVNALVGHCLSRENTGPVPGWIPDRPEPALDGPVGEAPVARTKADRPLAPKLYAPGSMIEALVDAAFDLGVLAARAGVGNTALGQLARTRRAAMVRRSRPRRTSA